MRIAFLSDIHGNALALDRCLARVHSFKVDSIHFLGDAVGYMPAAGEVLQRLNDESIECQQGNHERMLLFPTALSREREGIYRLRQTYAELEPELLKRIASWPTARSIACGKYTLLLVHGSPRSPLNGYVYPDSDLTEFRGIAADAVVMSHTHRPFVKQSGGKWFVNAGSVGLPRDHGNLASLAIYDSAEHRFEMVRVPFDVNEVLAAYGTRIADEVKTCLLRSGGRSVSNA
jgi:putative phosphoesterase